ncbi:hypothetical protein TSUD_48320 [Trifolium subterraneum]|nr:hypothetical protein TSUD_48320 [Trifolium subterraneum]
MVSSIEQTKMKIEIVKFTLNNKIKPHGKIGNDKRMSMIKNIDRGRRSHGEEGRDGGGFGNENGGQDLSDKEDNMDERQNEECGFDGGGGERGAEKKVEANVGFDECDH